MPRININGLSNRIHASELTIDTESLGRDIKTGVPVIDLDITEYLNRHCIYVNMVSKTAYGWHFYLLCTWWKSDPALGPDGNHPISSVRKTHYTAPRDI